MKIIVLSDTHFEHGTSPEKIVDKLADADVCVLAGDIFSAKFLINIEKAFDPFVRKYKHVVYVPGNHEFYGADINETMRLLDYACYKSGVYLITPLTPGEIDGKRFFGGTMWFPNAPMNAFYSKQLNDFNLIKNFTPWVYNENENFVKAADNIREGDIVVTHHLPSLMSVPKHYINDPLNCFFVCDMEKVIVKRKPKLWIHGHTHTPCDYMIGDTRIICNPYGYPREQTFFDFGKVVEI